MPSILALLNRTYFDREIRVAGRPATVGDVVPVDAYFSTSPRLAGLSDGGSLFLVAVRPPDNRLLLVAVLERPAFTGDRWAATPNTVAVTDLRDTVPKLVFGTGKGLTAPPEKLAMALQTPRILTAGDEALLRAAANTADPSAAGPGDPSPGGEAARDEAARDEAARDVAALAGCAALAGDDPAAAFGLALEVWRRTGWERLAELVERLALAGESEAAGQVRWQARRGKLPPEQWLAAARKLPEADRGALLGNLHELSAPILLDLLAHLGDWAPDPRVSAALHEVLRRKPWTYYDSRPTWVEIFRLLDRIGDRRLLAAEWVARDRTRPTVGRSLHDWVPQQVCKHADRLAAAPPPPPVSPEVEQLLTAIEQQLPTAAGSAARSTTDAAPPVAVAVPTVPLPTAIRERCNPPFAVMNLIEAHASGTRLLVGLRPRTVKADAIRYPDHAHMAALYGPDGTLEWGRPDCLGTVAVDPTGERVAVLTMAETGAVVDRDGYERVDLVFDLSIVRVADDTTLATWRLTEQRELRRYECDAVQLRVRWDLPSTVVALVATSSRFRMYAADAGTATLTVLDTHPFREGSGSSGSSWVSWKPLGAWQELVVDTDRAVVASHDNTRLYLHDLRTGHLLQACSIGGEVPEWRRDVPTPLRHLVPVGDGRYAFRSNNGGAAAPGDRGSFHNVVDGTTGFCVEESPLKENAGGGPSDRGKQPEVRTVRIRRGRSSAACTVQVETAEYWGWSDPRPVWADPNGAVRYLDLTGAEPAYAEPAGAGAAGAGAAPPSREAVTALPAVHRVAISPDGKVLAAAAGCCALIWSGGPKPARAMAGVVAGVGDLAISPSGLVAAVMGTQVEIRRPDGKKIGTLKGGRSPLVRVAACLAHDRFAVAARDGSVFLHDDEYLRTVEVGCLPEGGESTTLAWSPSGRLLAVGATNGAVVVADTGGTVLRRYDAGAPVREVAFAPGEDRLVFLTGDGRLGRLVPTGDVPPDWPVPTGREPRLTGLAVHQRYGWLAVGRADGRVTLHTADGAHGPDGPGRPVARHFGPVTSLAFAGDALVVGSGRAGTTGSLTVYDCPADAAGQGTGTEARP